MFILISKRQTALRWNTCIPIIHLILQPEQFSFQHNMQLALQTLTQGSVWAHFITCPFGVFFALLP